MKQRFGLKGALAGASGLFAMGSGVTAVAQEDDTDAEVEDDSSVAMSGGTTVSVVDGVASIEVEEEEEVADDDSDDDAADDDGADDDSADDDSADDDSADGAEDDDDDESEISVDGGTAIVDASGGDNNFSFVS